MKDTKVIVVAVIVFVLAGAGGFFAGMKYQQSRRGQFFGRNNSQSGNRNRPTGQQRFSQGVRPVRGEIISQDDKSITVKLADGSTKIILLSTDTSINKATAGTKDDLKTGEQVLVVGNQNSDGSISAQNIQLNPQNNFGQPQQQN